MLRRNAQMSMHARKLKIRDNGPMQHNPWQRALAQLEKIATLIELDPELTERLKQPDAVIDVSIPVEMDSGEVKTFRGYRVQHNNILGPYKGGLRYHPQVDLDEAKALAFWMTMKNALASVPLGGGKGGVEVNPKALSEGELERLTRAFTQKLSPHIGPERDVPAPDVNTNAKIMRWIVDEYSKIRGQHSPAVVTGKPVEDLGSEGRTEATGLGGAYVLLHILKKLEENGTLSRKAPRDRRVAIQGFGNVGSYLAKFLHAEGFRIVAISDSKGGVYEKDGIDPHVAEAYKQAHGTFAGFDGASLSPEAVLEVDADIVVPAALENAITEGNAPRIKAKVVLELANGPTTLEADQILNEKGVIVIPDILANAGGVVVSYFEWLQNRSNQRWTKEQVYHELKRKMETAAERVLEQSSARSLSLRDAAYVVALNRIKDTLH